jgi:C4-dicarboxylate-specific signal transduction histidine kinase
MENTLKTSKNVVQLRARIASLERSEKERKRNEMERETLLHDMKERVKELRCMYGISQAIVARNSLEEIFQDVVALIPPSWQYPEITRCRITLNGKEFVSESFRETRWKQSSDIVIDNSKCGAVEVYYKEKCRESDEGPFLKEERNLIDGIARTLSGVIKSRQAEDEKAKLQAQLRHADRLATIGQLAAGVAHELNEPLANILGFAQLSKKVGNLPGQVFKDLDKIDSAVLHCREIIRKLMAFARQMPPKTSLIDLNSVIKESLFLYEARCTKEGIDLDLVLAPVLPKIFADPGQVKQVIINLIINAMQAMPDGGRLTVKTEFSKENVLLIVEDTGTGMSRKIMNKIYLPFFTTKDVNQGTGLGLAVVYGIIDTHKGTIKVSSEPGRGTRFEILFPARASQK